MANLAVLKGATASELRAMEIFLREAADQTQAALSLVPLIGKSLSDGGPIGTFTLFSNICFRMRPSIEDLLATPEQGC